MTHFGSQDGTNLAVENALRPEAHGHRQLGSLEQAQSSKMFGKSHNDSGSGGHHSHRGHSTIQHWEKCAEQWAKHHKAVVIVVAVGILLLAVLLLGCLCRCLCRRRKEHSLRRYLVFNNSLPIAHGAALDGIVQGDVPPSYTASLPLQDVKIFDTEDANVVLLPAVSAPPSDQVNGKTYGEYHA